MLYLGLVTGLRPSTLRPLRRRGAECDVQWDQGRLFVRRSHSLGEEVMRTTKQKRRYAIDLPPEAMAVLRWHVDTQLTTPEQEDSDLLFPAVTGGFRTQKVLNVPIAETAGELGITKHLTQRALRRTFNDLARAAQVNDLVTRSISGHLTEAMQHHYSTVNGNEQRAALAKVIRLVDARPPRSASSTGAGGEDGGEGQPSSGEECKTG
jgi:integrase